MTEKRRDVFSNVYTMETGCEDPVYLKRFRRAPNGHFYVSDVYYLHLGMLICWTANIGRQQ